MTTPKRGDRVWFTARKDGLPDTVFPGVVVRVARSGAVTVRVFSYPTIRIREPMLMTVAAGDTRPRQRGDGDDTGRWRRVVVTVRG